VGLRKFLVGLVVLAALLVGYLVYAQLGGTPPVELDLPVPLPGPTEPGTDAGDDAIGTVDGVGIGPLKQTRLFHTNENQQVDRELGFEELHHEEGEQWQMTYPFMKLYLPEFRCDVTADRGTFQLETAFGKLMPNDAVFQGNVVIHIVPPEPNDPMECFIYLDDVAFVADQSLFSSNGAVKFVSRSAALEGTGLELIYDGARRRLELFRVTDLDSLRLRSAEIGSLSSVTGPDEGAASPDARVAVEPAAAETAASQSRPPAADDRADGDDPDTTGVSSGGTLGLTRPSSSSWPVTGFPSTTFSGRSRSARPTRPSRPPSRPIRTHARWCRFRAPMRWTPPPRRRSLSTPYRRSSTTSS